MEAVSTLISKAKTLSMKMKQKKTKQKQKQKQNNIRPWSDLPSEILSQISDRLRLIDLLRFRSVCKQWKLASSTSTAESESSPDRYPWFLVYGQGSQCRLTSESGEKFAVDIPNLDSGATCLASSHGWLLILLQNQGSIFFLCPFSGARIDLPSLDKSDLSERQVAAFSAPPSELDCHVAVISRKNPSILALNLIRRGEPKWTALEFSSLLPETVGCGAYRGGSFYFFDGKDGMAIFSLESRDLKPYRVIEARNNDAKDESAERIPFAYHRDSLNDTKRWAGIDDGDSVVSTCGTLVKSNKNDYVVFDEGFGEESSGRSLKGVWIHPRFFKVPKDETIKW